MDFSYSIYTELIKIHKFNFLNEFKVHGKGPKTDPDGAPQL